MSLKNPVSINDYFKKVVEASLDGVAVFSVQGRASYISPAVATLLGYTEDVAKDVDFFSIIHVDDLIAIRSLWDSLICKPGECYPGNRCRVLHQDGTWRWLEATMTNLLDDCDVRGVIIGFRDITEKLENEDKLRSSEQSYRHLFFNNPLPMWIYDLSTLQFLEVNEAAIQKYGYSREEFLNLTITDIRPSEDGHKLKEAIRNRKSKSFVKGNLWRHVTKKRKQIIVEITSHSIHFNGHNAVLVLVSDVTEKKRAEQMASKAHEQNTAILESITDGFFAVDQHWIITYWNKKAEQLVGLSREEIVGNNLWKIFENTDDLKFHSEYQRAMTEKVQVHFEEYYYPVSMWIDVTAYPSDEGLAVYFRDITEKIEIEKALRETGLQRQRIVTAATIQGQEKEKEQIGRELHDNINQILAAAILYLDQAVSSEDSQGKISESKELIVMAAREIRSLSHTLLTPALHEFGLLKSIDDLMRPIKVAGELHVIKQWESFPENMLSVEQQLTIYRIVQEQLNNILKHASAKTIRISLSLLNEKRFTELLIVDDGKGFDTSLKKEGVGIRNIKSRAELFDGDVYIWSEPGQGCKLSVIFPLSKRNILSVA